MLNDAVIVPALFDKQIAIRKLAADRYDGPKTCESCAFLRSDTEYYRCIGMPSDVNSLFEQTPLCRYGMETVVSARFRNIVKYRDDMVELARYKKIDLPTDENFPDMTGEDVMFLTQLIRSYIQQAQNNPNAVVTLPRLGRLLEVITKYGEVRK